MNPCYRVEANGCYTGWVNSYLSLIVVGPWLWLVTAGFGVHTGIAEDGVGESSGTGLRAAVGSVSLGDLFGGLSRICQN